MKTFVRSLVASGILVISLAMIASAESIDITTPDCFPTFNKNSKGQIIITAPDYAIASSPGNPALPYKQISVLIPPTVEAKDLQVSIEPLTDNIFPTADEIAPAKPIAPFDDESTLFWGSGKTIVDGKNASVYGQDAFYPASHVEVATVGDMRKWRIAQIHFYPYQYNPYAKKLRYARKGLIRVTFPDGSIQKTMVAKATFLTNDDTLDNVAEGLAVNYDQARSWYPAPGAIAQQAGARVLDECPDGKCDFMIITTQAIKEANAAILERFADHKRDFDGFNVCILTEKTWGGGTGDGLTWTYPGGDNYQGKFWEHSYLQDGAYKLYGDPKAPFPAVINPAPERLRAFLKSNYLALGTKFLLLIGNPDPRTGDLPMKRLEADFKYEVNQGEDNNAKQYRGDAPSDFFFADLGSKSSDLMDWMPELFVGRIPYYHTPQDPERLTHILQKIINYEKGIQSDYDDVWMKKVLLTMVTLNSETFTYQLGDNIIQYITSTMPGYQGTRIYSQENIPKAASLPGSAAPLAVENAVVVPEWQKHYGFHFWYTHGRPALAKGGVLSLPESATLDDSHPSFVFQASCMNGFPEVVNNLGYALLYNGAIATVSASRVGMMIIGETDYRGSASAGGIAYDYAYHLIKKNEPCGQAWAMANSERRGIAELKMNNLVFNLYGDPSVSPRTGVGFSIRHTPLSNMEDGSGPYSVKATLTHGRGYRDAKLSLFWAVNNTPEFNEIPMNTYADGEFHAEIQPAGKLAPGTSIRYYIQARDAQNKILNHPFDAPKSLHTFMIKQDTSAPTMTLLTDTTVWGTDTRITVQINDASDVDAQLVYKIDSGTEQAPLAMLRRSAAVFETTLPAPKPGETAISFRIVATDNSAAKNIGYYPGLTTYKQLKAAAASPKTPVVSVVRSSSSSGDQLVVLWTTQPDIAEYQYRIARDALNGAEAKGWTSVGKSCYVRIPLTDLAAGTAYYVAVKALGVSGLWSAEGYIQATTIISAPVLTSAALTDGSVIKLTLKPSAYQVTGYIIERKIDNGAWMRAGRTTASIMTTWSETINTPGTYYYRICSYKLGNSPYSNTISVPITGQMLKPCIPQNVQAMLVVTAARFTAISYSDTSLTANAVFNKLSAAGWFNLVGPQEATLRKNPISSAAELKTLFPQDYRKISAVLQAPQIRISWMKNAIGAVDAVLISRGRIGQTLTQIKEIPTATAWRWSFIDTSTELLPNTYYSYSVKFRNTAGLSAATTVVAKTPAAKLTADTTPPVNMIIQVPATTSSTNLLNAYFNAEDPESEVSSFEYRIKEANSQSTIPITKWIYIGKKPGMGTQVVFSGYTLKKGYTYFFEVTAVNGAGLTTTITSSGTLAL